MLRNVLFIARKDFLYTFRDRVTIAWLVVMPTLFFAFIGTATGGYGTSGDAARDEMALELPADAGFLGTQLAMRLEQAGFDVVTFTDGTPQAPRTEGEAAPGFDSQCRRLTVPPGLTGTIRSGSAVQLDFATCSDALRANLDRIRVQRAVYTTLADIVAADAGDTGLSEAGIFQLNDMARALTLDTRPAGRKREIPSGFAQAVPGTMVWLTMLVLLTSGAIALLIERQRGLLRRLASAPLRRGEIVLGKWLGKMALAGCQLVIAMTIGTALFRVHWQPDLAMIALLLMAWAGVCTSLALVLGSVGSTEGQVAGIGVLSAMLLGGLGGCWWPIEVAPPWMQTIAGLLPTGWTMNGLHKLMSFETGAASALPELGLLLATAAVLGVLATRRFRYE